MTDRRNVRHIHAARSEAGASGAMRYGLDDLVNFGLIAEAGGITAASRRHGLPKTSLSRAIARLEAVSGVALFDRVGRGLQLTAFGTRLVACAEDALRVSRETERTLLDVLGEPRGPLRIGAGVHGTLLLAAPVIARLQRRWPALESSLRLVSGESSLHDDRLDVLLGIGRPADENLVSRRILSLERRLYVSAVLADTLDTGDPDAITTLPRVIIDVGGGPPAWKLRGPDGRCLMLDSPPAVVVQDAGVAFDIVRHGTGMALLPAMFVANRDDGETLVQLLPRFTCSRSEVYASFPPHRTEVPAVRAFIDLLVEHAGQIEIA